MKHIIKPLLITSIFACLLTACGGSGSTSAPSPTPDEEKEKEAITITSVVSGYYATMIIKSDGSLWATGKNDHGKLGLPIEEIDTSDLPPGASILPPEPLSEVYYQNKIMPSGVKMVSTRNHHTLIVKTDGSLWGMGRNQDRQLGIANTGREEQPVKLIDSGVKSAFAGANHSIIIKTDGSLWAAGDNTYGQLGDGTTSTAPIPDFTKVIASDVKNAAVGDNHTLVIKTDGSLWAFGRNNEGQIGNDLTADQTLPVQVFGDAIVHVSAGNGYSLFVTNDNALWAMGSNEYGQFGNNDSNAGKPKVTRAIKSISSGVESISAGSSHVMILKTDGSLWATGYGGNGRLGNDSLTNVLTPVKIMRANEVEMASAGGTHTMIVKTDGTLWATGGNDFGQYGNDTTLTSYTPIKVTTK